MPNEQIRRSDCHAKSHHMAIGARFRVQRPRNVASHGAEQRAVLLAAPCEG